jgi:hypothetical protein
MGFWSSKKDPKKQREKEIAKRGIQQWLPKRAEVMSDYERLSRKEKKQFDEIAEELNLFMRLGSPSYYDHIDLTSISKDSPEYHKLKEASERVMELAEEYISKHPEIPEKFRILILRFVSLEKVALDSLAWD